VKARVLKALQRSPVLVGPVVVAAVLSGCLGPTAFDPTGRAPIGALDLIVDAAGSVKVAGWALDPETSASIVVKVGSEGVVHDVAADRARPDVGAAYPGMGAAHGFEHTFGPLSPGLHGVCVWVPNTVGGGDDRLLGCKNLWISDPNPVGNLEVVTSLSPQRVRVAGWAFDPNSGDPVEVGMTVDGQFGARIRADVDRPDVGTAYGRSPRAGFDTELTVSPGTHQVCVGVFNLEWGADRLLGCRNVTVAQSTEDRRPSGELTEVVPLGGAQVRVSGTATDPDGSVAQVRLEVDNGRPGAQVIQLPVLGGSFSTVVSGLADGLHTFCPVGIDVLGGAPGLSGERAFLCGSAVLGSTAVGTGGTASSPTPVGSPAGNPLDGAERDAGVSTVLRDGSVMWFFGDTLERDQVGNLTYFVNNTAAWAAAGAPTVTRDGSVGGQPVPFVTAPADWCSGEPEHPSPAMWPESAVAIPQPDGHTDRVVVFMSKVCLGDQFLEIVAKGMAVVETTYDMNAKPIEVPVTGVVTQADLAVPATAWGRGAFLDDDGFVYAYHCGSFPGQWGPCRAARVVPGSITTSSAWRYWDGDDWTSAGNWVSDPGAAAPMTAPDGVDGFSLPISAFTITEDEQHGAYVMVYSPWPGFTDRVHVRVATTPVGPWTAPVEVFLPGCNDTNGGVQYLCYAGTAQPKLDQAGLLGLGYFDQLVQVGPTRGQYLTVTVPFSVVVTPAP
jgi:hypothetical protein